MKSRRWTRAGDTLEQAGADRGEPAEQRRVLAQDRLLTLGAGGDEAEGHADQLLQALEVAPRLRRQVGLVLGAAGRRAPALDLLVEGFSLGDDVLVLGELREDVAAVAVAHADLHRLALVEYVELGQRDRVQAVDARGVTPDDRVEPATASRPPRRGAVLVAARADRLGERARHLGRKRPRAHARRVGLRDAEHAVQTRGRDPRAGRRATGGRGRRGDVRVRAVVDVEHRGLRALEEHAVAIVDPAREQQGGVGDVGCEPAGVAEVLVEDLLHREGLRVIDLAQEPILLRDVQLEFLAEEPLVEEIGCRTYFSRPTTTVWPALLPPANRATTLTWGARRSTTFPLPSSPHCVPTTTMLGMAPTPKEAPRLRQDLRHGQDALGAVREIEREELGGLRARAPDDQDVAHALSARVGDRLLEPAADDVARDRRARGAQPPGERQCRGLVSREVDDEEVGSR